MSGLAKALGVTPTRLAKWAAQNPGEMARLHAYLTGGPKPPEAKTILGGKLGGKAASWLAGEKLLREARTLTAPKPPVPKPQPVPAPAPAVPELLRGRTLFVTWGLSNGQFSESQIAAWARTNDYARVALQLDGYGNAGRTDAMRASCRAFGRGFGIWQTAPDLSQQVTGSGDFYIAEVESPGDLQALLDAPAPPVPRAIVTNFNGLNAAKAAALRDKGYLCMAESVLPENPSATPERVVARAVQEFGWPLEHVVPVLYLNGGKTFTDYGDLARWPGYGIWSAEYLYG